MADLDDYKLACPYDELTLDELQEIADMEDQAGEDKFEADRDEQE